VDINSLFEQSIIVQILYNNRNIIDGIILSELSTLEKYRIVRYNNIINKLNKFSNIILH